MSLVPGYTQIRRLEAAIAELPPAQTRVTDHYADGIYGRELFAPAGTVMTGKIHRHSTLNILLQGRIRATGPDGSVVEMVAPMIFVSPAGTKKVGFVLEDAIWVNVHPTKLKDVAAIEAKFIVPEAPAIEGEEALWLGSQ